MATRQETNSTIRFSARLSLTAAARKFGSDAILTIPKGSDTELLAGTKTRIEGTLNGYPFRAVVARDERGAPCFAVTPALQAAAGVESDDIVPVEITRLDDELEVRTPDDLRQALAADAAAQATWTAITPMARRDWVLWLSSAKLVETRGVRIEKAISMLGAGKRRVCCFGGLNWLTKDHATVETWLPLPKAAARSKK